MIRGLNIATTLTTNMILRRIESHHSIRGLDCPSENLPHKEIDPGMNVAAPNKFLRHKFSPKCNSLELENLEMEVLHRKKDVESTHQTCQPP